MGLVKLATGRVNQVIVIKLNFNNSPSCGIHQPELDHSRTTSPGFGSGAISLRSFLEACAAAAKFRSVTFLGLAVPGICNPNPKPLFLGVPIIEVIDILVTLKFHPNRRSNRDMDMDIALAFFIPYRLTVQTNFIHPNPMPTQTLKPHPFKLHRYSLPQSTTLQKKQRHYLVKIITFDFGDSTSLLLLSPSYQGSQLQSGDSIPHHTLSIFLPFSFQIHFLLASNIVQLESTEVF
ncbi:hypothetical protein V8G54_025827 [Vigna mungo]|uniref:Uncharacterized protein n=1 Tax=Vigna mungo TaxID=3915 RepID=A0AAQ3MZ46_VIGMU